MPRSGGREARTFFFAHVGFRAESLCILVALPFTAMETAAAADASQLRGPLHAGSAASGFACGLMKRPASPAARGAMSLTVCDLQISSLFACRASPERASWGRLCSFWAEVSRHRRDVPWKGRWPWPAAAIALRVFPRERDASLREQILPLAYWRISLLLYRAPLFARLVLPACSDSGRQAFAPALRIACRVLQSKEMRDCP